MPCETCPRRTPARPTIGRMTGYAFPDAFADLDEIWEYIAEVPSSDSRGFLKSSFKTHRKRPSLARNSIHGPRVCGYGFTVRDTAPVRPLALAVTVALPGAMALMNLRSTTAMTEGLLDVNVSIGQNSEEPLSRSKYAGTETSIPPSANRCPGHSGHSGRRRW